jgi:hypothetical protein
MMLTSFREGEIMKKSYLIVVLTLTCLLGSAISANAQDVGRVSVTVGFEFVAGGQIMPAGTYTVGRVHPDPLSGLIIRTYGNSALLLPIAVDDASADHAELSFEHVGDKYFLTKIKTPAGVYTIETPQAITKLAQMKDHGTLSSSGN